MSVLKNKRTTSAAEYVNTAHLANLVMDRAEEANKIFPSDQYCLL